MTLLFAIFFFQAEDGIRYHCVTGVQTCALPIYLVERVWRLWIYLLLGCIFQASTLAMNPPTELADQGFLEDIHFDASHRQMTVDRKSTRLNSSHTVISYAVFCLKKNRPRSLRSSANYSGSSA